MGGVGGWRNFFPNISSRIMLEKEGREGRRQGIFFLISVCLCSKVIAAEEKTEEERKQSNESGGGGGNVRLYKIRLEREARITDSQVYLGRAYVRLIRHVLVVL